MKTLLRRSALVLAAAVALSGCVKLDMDLKLGNDEKVSGNMVVAFSSEMLTMLGQTEKQFLDEMNKDNGDLPKGASSSVYKKDGWIGTQIKFSGLPAKEFASVAKDAGSAASSTGGAGASPDDLTLVKVGGKWRLSGTMDMSSGTESDPKSGGMDPTAMMSMFKNKPSLRIKMSFPKKPSRCGKDKTAKISGNSAEWTPKMGQKVVLCAEA